MMTGTQTERPRHCTAFRATLDLVEGIALRETQDRVFFADDATGVWQELFDRDMPRLTLCGRLDLIQAQAMVDGELSAAVLRRNSYHSTGRARA